MRPRQIVIPFLAGVALLAMPASAHADRPSALAPDDANVRLIGATLDVDAAGDVDGDGRQDLLVVTGTYESATAWVIFGRATFTAVDLTSVGSSGFRIGRGGGATFSALTAEPAGDVNDDGRDDILVSAPLDDHGAVVAAGTAWVVHGKPGTTAVDVDALGSGGFRIDGSRAQARLGIRASTAGDMNGDGYDDVALSERRTTRGDTYVVYGSGSTDTVRLADNGPRSFAITNTSTADSATQWVGVALAPAGDMNADGLDDLLVVGSCEGAGCTTDRSWVIFGNASSSAWNLANPLGDRGVTYVLGTQGITGSASVAAKVGDVDDDGVDDVAIASTNGPRRDGSTVAWVLPGTATPATIDLRSAEASPLRVLDGESNDAWTVGPVGDVDGNGRDDLSVGSAVVLSGYSRTVDLRDLAGRGFRLPGFGLHVGDATGAGGALGARGAQSFWTFPGMPAPEIAGPAQLVYTSGTSITPVPFDLAYATPPAVAVSPALPAGLTLDPNTGVLRGTPTAATPVRTYTATITDAGGSRSGTFTLRVDSDAVDLDAPAASAALGTARPTFSWQRGDAPDATEPLTGYELWLDDGKVQDVAPAACCTAQPPGNLADGAHTWSVRALGPNGRVRASAARSFTVAVPPIAALVAPAVVLTGEPATVRADGSHDPNGRIVEYRWDLDGNGDFETSTGRTASATTTFASPGTHRVAVQVVDPGGNTAQHTATVEVRPAPPAGEVGVSINGGDIATNDPDVLVAVTWPRLASSMLLSNDGGFGTAGATRLLPVAPQTGWRLASSGPERLPKIVYLRFRGAASDTETFTDDIILDERVPSVTSATMSGGAARAAAAKPRRVTVRLSARDDSAGVAVVQVAARRGGKPLVERRMTSRRQRGKRRLDTRLPVRTAARTLYVRVLDNASNPSAWKRVTTVKASKRRSR